MQNQRSVVRLFSYGYPTRDLNGTPPNTENSPIRGKGQGTELLSLRQEAQLLHLCQGETALLG